jgi:hypothetical protein
LKKLRQDGKKPQEEHDKSVPLCSHFKSFEGQQQHDQRDPSLSPKQRAVNQPRTCQRQRQHR